MNKARLRKHELPYRRLKRTKDWLRYYWMNNRTLNPEME